MSNGCVEFDYITPGSPIEQYLASVGQGECEFDEETEAELKDPSLFAFFESKLKNAFIFLKQTYNRIDGTYQSRYMSLEYEARRSVLEQIQPLLIDDDFYRHEELVDKLQVRVKPVDFEFGINLWVVPLPIVYTIWLGTFWSNLSLPFLVAHFIIFLVMLYAVLTMIHKRLQIYTLAEIIAQNTRQIDAIFEQLREVDAVLRKSLRLLRDTEVIKRGYTLHTSPGSPYRADEQTRLRCEIADFVRDISKCLADVQAEAETSDLESLLMAYQTNRSNLLGHLFLNLLDQDCTVEMISDIKSRISLLEMRVESIRRVRDIEPQPAPVHTTDTTKITLLRSLSLHAQLLTRTSYEAEQNGYDQQTMHQLRAHLRAINEVFYLFENYDSDDKPKMETKSAPDVVSDACQTSLGPASLEITKDDVEGDIVIEAVVDGNYHPVGPVNQSNDEIDVTAKVASSHVVNELKSVLPLQVNAERRQTRKKALFPEYWESRSENSDIILPEVTAFSLSVSEPSVVSTNDDVDTDEEPLLFDDEKERLESRRQNHAFCCAEQSSLAHLLAQQVAAKSKKQTAQEYLYDVEDSS